MKYIISDENIENYKKYLACRELSVSTIKIYINEILLFRQFVGGNILNKETVINWKEKMILKNYSASSINISLTALNGFFKFMEWNGLNIKPVKQQKNVFRNKKRELSKNEYMRLLNTAKEQKDYRIYYIMETLCATGIRISELKFITLEAVKSGVATVDCKGKRRVIILSKKLCEKLLKYCKTQGIVSGTVFITKSGKAVDRSNVWRDMKKLCKAANVDENKVFPHNFRHLFAVTFYSIKRDIAKLADLLGHSSIETTRIYIMESGEEHARLIEKMGLVV